MITVIVAAAIGAAVLLSATGYALYRLAFWHGPADRWEARHPLHHLSGNPGYELSDYDNFLRALHHLRRDDLTGNHR